MKKLFLFILFPHHTNISAAQSVNFIKNKISLENHKTASTEHYLQLLNSKNPSHRFSGNLGLAKISKENMDYDGFIAYTTAAYTSLQEMQKMYSENTLAEMEKIIDEAELENENIRLKNENKYRHLSLILISIITLLIGLLLILVVYRSYLGKTKNALEMETMKAHNLRMIRSLEKRLATTEALFEDRQRKIEEFENNLALENVIDEITDLFSSPPALPTQQHINRLHKALQKNNPTFIAALDALHLSESLYQDALLTKINVPAKLCAEFFSSSIQKVYSARNRFLKKITTENKPKNWSDFIKSL